MRSSISSGRLPGIPASAARKRASPAWGSGAEITRKAIVLVPMKDRSAVRRIHLLEEGHELFGRGEGGPFAGSHVLDPTANRARMGLQDPDDEGRQDRAPFPFDGLIATTASGTITVNGRLVKLPARYAERLRRGAGGGNGRLPGGEDRAMIRRRPICVRRNCTVPGCDRRSRVDRTQSPWLCAAISSPALHVLAAPPPGSTLDGVRRSQVDPRHRRGRFRKELIPGREGGGGSPSLHLVCAG